MRDLGKTSNNVISLVLKALPLYGRPAELPRLPAGHHLFCGYDQGMGERLFLVETLGDAQQLDDAYANGGALTIRWYSAPVIFTADEADDHRPRYEGPGPLRYERPSKS